ncbi:MAG: hypothetical protein IPL97_07565 [Niastella sp.]|nr:hypothetical protein [Niastella sp.]
MRIVLLLVISILITGLFTSCSKSGENPNPPSNTDSFMVTVNHGYGAGKFKTGDTVHIFSNAWSAGQVFGSWVGDINLLDGPDEWHTWFIMPNKNVSFTGNLVNIPNYTLHYESIMGRDRMKNVYSYFPTGHKGIVYLLHGTSGTAANIAGDYEWQQFIKDLVNNNFGIIITEAEEATTHIDANGDGKLRWYLLPVDTINNVDFANIRIITDTFYNRGITNRQKPRYSVGMSNGGFFSGALSYVYNFKAGVQYCAQGGSNLPAFTTIPTQFCMARFDDNDEVGPAGNAAAFNYFNQLNARGICSKYFITERSPLYPERIARSGEISIAQGIDIVNELKAKNYMDNRNYFIGNSDSLVADLQANPALFPVIVNMSLTQKQFLLAQINISRASHHIYSDYNRATIHFLNVQCQ